MLNLTEPLIPTEKDVLLARESQRQIGSAKFERVESVGVEINGQRVSIPAGVARMMIELLGRMAKGRTLAVMELEEEVSPQEAAELLNVSRPFATKLFDQGAIPSRKVGSHRRALTADVLAYKQREKEARLEALQELVAEGQRLKLGY